MMQNIENILKAILFAITLIIIGKRLTRIIHDFEYNMHEYQIEINMDSAHVYQNGRYVGSYKYADTLIGFENLVAEDNR